MKDSIICYALFAHIISTQILNVKVIIILKDFYFEPKKMGGGRGGQTKNFEGGGYIFIVLVGFSLKYLLHLNVAEILNTQLRKILRVILRNTQPWEGFGLTCIIIIDLLSVINAMLTWSV